MAWNDVTNAWVSTEYGNLQAAVEAAAQSSPSLSALEGYSKRLEILLKVAKDVLKWQETISRRDLMQGDIENNRVSDATLPNAQATVASLTIEIAYIELNTQINKLVYAATV
jgi:hypothetical protein